jgi:hypothetical protein
VLRQASQRQPPPVPKPQAPAYDFTLEDISFEQSFTKPAQVSKPPANAAPKQPPKPAPMMKPAQTKQAPTFDYSSLMDFEDT